MNFDFVLHMIIDVISKFKYFLKAMTEQPSVAEQLR